MEPFGSNYPYGQSFYKDEGFFDSSFIFAYLPNWKYEVAIDYKFETVIAVKEKLSEQRRALYNKIRRTERFTVTYFNDTYKFLNFLTSIKSVYTPVPVFTEACLPSIQTSLKNISDITCLNDLTYFFNLQLRPFSMVIIDFINYVGQVLYLSSVENNTLHFSNSVSTDLLGKNCVIYPIFPGFISNFKQENITDTVTNYNVEFNEYV